MKTTPQLAACLAILAVFLQPSLAGAQDIELRPVFSGLTEPLDIQFPPDGSGRIFVVERGGDIRIFNGTSLLGTPFISIGASLDTAGSEKGLLGLAFHPQYATDGRFWVYATIPGNQIGLIEGEEQGNPDLGGSLDTILSFSHGATDANHNGGQIGFGPDGYLYVGVGDGGGVGDPDDNAQDTTVLLGKILRLDVSTPGGYTIPPTNPFSGEGVNREEIWDYGLRNPWRFSWDRDTGDFWISDVGQNAFEEVNLEPASSTGEVNYGWNPMEAESCYLPNPTCEANPIAFAASEGYTLPVIVYPHTNVPCDSLTGGFRYRGGAIPAIDAKYIYGDYCNGTIFAATQGGSWSSSTLLNSGFQFAISTFGEDPEGELWMAHYGTGTIYKVVPPVPNIRLSGSCPGNVTVEIDGASNDGRVFVGIANSVGATALGGSVCNGAVVPLASPSLAAVLRARADGTVRRVFNLGAGQCGRVVAVVDRDTCEVSAAASVPN